MDKMPSCNGQVVRLMRGFLLFFACSISGPTFAKLAWHFPPLLSLLRVLDTLGRPAAVAVRQNETILGPHFPCEVRAQFRDEQLSPHGMQAMIAEHGSQVLLPSQCR